MYIVNSFGVSHLGERLLCANSILKCISHHVPCYHHSLYILYLTSNTGVMYRCDLQDRCDTGMISHSRSRIKQTLRARAFKSQARLFSHHSVSALNRLKSLIYCPLNTTQFIACCIVHSTCYPPGRRTSSSAPVVVLVAKIAEHKRLCLCRHQLSNPQYKFKSKFNFWTDT